MSLISYKKPPAVLAILAGVFVIAAIVFSIFSVMPGTIASLAVAGALTAFYLFRLSASARNAGASKELGKLAEEFKQRTSKQSLNMASLLTESEKQKEYYDKSRLLKEQLDLLSAENLAQKSKISQLFYALTGKQVSGEQWQEVLAERRQENRLIAEK